MLLQERRHRGHLLRLAVNGERALHVRLDSVEPIHKPVLVGMRGERVDRVHARLERHLLVTAIGDNVIRLVPPLIITEEDCDEACRIIGSAIEALVKA